MAQLTNQVMLVRGNCVLGQLVDWLALEIQVDKPWGEQRMKSHRS